MPRAPAPRHTQAGLVSAAADAAASAKARRKRKQRQAVAGAGAKAAAWANAKSQKRAFTAAWLALLRMDLPADIYRKACGPVEAGVGGDPGDAQPKA